MRILKLLSVFLPAAALIGFIGVNSPVMAGSGDPPHDTHFVDVKGPGLTDPDDCDLCHTGPQNETDVDYNACNICHGPGGVYDGVNDPDVGAVNNWENTGSSTGATQSLIYELDGSLKSGKDKWCATCHDQDPSDTGTLVDDFETYNSSKTLRAEWKRGADAKRPYFESAGGRGGSKGMRAKLEWDKKTKKYGVVKRIFSTPLDLRGTDAISFYVKISKVRKIRAITVKLRKLSDGQFSKASFKTHDLIVDGILENRQWFLVVLPRESFSDPAWGKVTEIQFQIKEKQASNALNTANVYFDNIYAIKVGANVVGDDTTYGFYQTGHGAVDLSCTWCHDPTSDHLDGDTRPIFDYIKDIDNLTGFRFYAAYPELQMQLPYTEYWPGSEYNKEEKTGAFALCYQCHDEACITQDESASLLNTNFTDTGPIAAGPDNLHLLHVGGPVPGNLDAAAFHGTCVLCHDPHGQLNPAMTRREMGNFIYFDADGCEIERGADTDSDDVMDWYDPDVNVGGALSEGIFTVWPDMCITCHLDPVPPNESPCDSGNNPYVASGLMDGWYERTYGDACEATFTTQSHSTHKTAAKGPMLGEGQDACDVCHNVTPLKDACTECHSPGGAFDGVDDSVIGAWANWADGIYEVDGVTLKSGKEQWCAGCHDDEPASTNQDGSGPSAPNVVGGYDSTWDEYYGFYMTGHGASPFVTRVECPDCHDAGKNHIDGEHRTYEAALDNYVDGYRLGGYMKVPREEGREVEKRAYASLCFECHVPGDLLYGITHSNFVDLDGSPQRNLHYLHFGIADDGECDSDFDDVQDTAATCTSCHNVHGARNSVMIRSGELMSTPGTTDRTPALAFTYLTAGGEDPYAALDETEGGDMQYGTGGFGANHICGDCHSTQDYYRAPRLCPDLLDRKATPGTVPHDGTTAVLFTARVLDPDDNLDTVEIDLLSVGGVEDQQMYDDETHGDVIGWDGVFSFETTVPSTVNSQPYNLIVTATDLDPCSSEGVIRLQVLSPGEIIIDNSDPEATKVGSWLTSTGKPDERYGPDVWYKAAGSGSAYVTWTVSIDTPGDYNVYARWTDDANRADNAPYTIYYDGGSDELRVNQQINGGQWNLLGTYPFIVGTSGYVQFSDDANGLVIADAIMWKPVDGMIAGQITASAVGVDGITVELTGDGTDSTVTAGGGYYSFFVADGNYTVTPASDSWDYTPPTRAVEVAGADVLNQDFEAYNWKGTIIDNPEAIFVGVWPEGPGQGDQYGYNVQYNINEAGVGNDTATWIPVIPVGEDGDFKVYAWWSVYTNRATDAPYTIYYDGDSDTVDVNQQINGGQWNLLGTYPFIAGTSGYVQLSDDANGLVIADAIKWELQE